MYVSNDNTPATEYADYKFFSSPRRRSVRAIYTYQLTRRSLVAQDSRQH